MKESPIGKPIGTDRARELGKLSSESPKSPIGKPISPDRARELSALRRTHGAGPGRPRSNAARCACGRMTLRLALRRGHECGYEERSHKRKEAP